MNWFANLFNPLSPWDRSIRSDRDRIERLERQVAFLVEDRRNTIMTRRGEDRPKFLGHENGKNIYKMWSTEECAYIRISTPGTVEEAHAPEQEPEPPRPEVRKACDEAFKLIFKDEAFDERLAWSDRYKHVPFFAPPPMWVIAGEVLQGLRVLDSLPQAVRSKLDSLGDTMQSWGAE
jgi:hypothetical protein